MSLISTLPSKSKKKKDADAYTLLRMRFFFGILRSGACLVNKKFIKTIITVLITVFSITGSFDSFAGAKTGEILSFRKQGDKLFVFVANPENAKDFDISCQIGARAAGIVEIVPIMEGECPIETLILIDNSISIREGHRQFISALLFDIVDNRQSNELITISTFSDRIENVIKSSTDNEAIRNAITQIVYRDQETYLTDILYELFSGFSGVEGDTFRRIVIVSDGVDNKAIGYTKDELNTIIKENPCPIYSLGCSTGRNNEELKNMFALSRMTGGTAFLVDEMNDSKEAVAGILESNRTLRVTVQLAEEDMDGTEKAVRIRVNSFGSVDNSFQTKMPFVESDNDSISVETEHILEDVDETEKEALTEKKWEETTAVIEESEEESEPDNSVPRRKVFLFIVIIIFGLMLAAVAARLLIAKKKKTNITYDVVDDQRTERISDDEAQTERLDDERTMILVNSYIALKDEEHPKKKYQAELGGSVTVGRSMECEIVINDDSVSRKHCCFFSRGSKVMVQNLSQMNGTVVDGTKITDICEVVNGTKLKLGRVSLTIELSN